MAFSKKTRTGLLAFGYYQVIGGVIGVCLICWLLTTISAFNALLLFIIVPAFLLFFYSIYCGSLLVRLREKGIKLSFVNQYLQLFSFAAGGYAFQYVAGVYLSIGWGFTGPFNILFGAGVSSWQLSINTTDPSTYLNFNFVALIAIVALVKIQARIKDEQAFNLFEESGLPD